MSDEFQDAKLRIGWANEGIAQFERCARLFFKRVKYTRIVDPDPDGIHERHKFKLLKPLPSSLTKHAVHAIEDLRSALDLTAVTVARLTGLPDANDFYFPFCKSAADLKSRVNSACKGFPDEVKTLFASFEPYQGGSNLLFAINELCNASKHRIIVPVGSKAGVAIPYMMGFGRMGPIQIFEGVWPSEDNEITYAITERGLQWKHHVQIAFSIAFGKVGIAEGYEVYPNLMGMLKGVTEIVSETEAMCRHLGLIN